MLVLVWVQTVYKGYHRTIFVIASKERVMYSLEASLVHLLDKCIIGKLNKSDADRGFLERGFLCLKVWGFSSADLSHFFINIP